VQGRWKTRSAIGFIALARDLITSTNLPIVDVLGTQPFALFPRQQLEEVTE